MGDLVCANSPCCPPSRSSAPVLADFRTRLPRVRIATSQPEEATAVGELVRTGRAELGFLDQLGATGERWRRSTCSTTNAWPSRPEPGGCRTRT
ncbi:hypothetical protein [Nocardiopsis sp. NRRL B-16309]|uniref:hypothetical protein n=1 Tax=Nocardiopsis sp. NRRL B-16309 TaxID=1519494 RepID=UPI000A59B807|nr:hypothetical protein [Nocardiopsis sp. NRRL B-16309]